MLDWLVTQEQDLTEACSGMQVYPQTMINVPISKPLDLEQSPQIRDALATAESELAQTGRVLLRPSGTEPLIRVMVEGRDAGLVQDLAARLAKTVGEAAQA